MELLGGRAARFYKKLHELRHSPCFLLEISLMVSTSSTGRLHRTAVASNVLPNAVFVLLAHP